MSALYTKEQILQYLQGKKDSLQHIGITKLGLFGSYARDEAHIASDIDIVLCTNEDFAKKGIEAVLYLEALREELRKNFRLEVDLCDIASMNSQRQDILLKGVIYV